MRPLAEGLVVAAILLATVAVGCGFGFLLWIVVARAPDSLATEVEAVALGLCLILLFWYADDD